MKKIAFASLLFLVAAYVPTDAERARWTLHDMRSWKIALEAYKLDHNRYPAASTIEEVAAAVEPRYIRKAPRTDAWGHPYVYEGTADGFRLVSAGADGKVARQTWSEPGKDLSLEADAAVSADAKFWFRSWTFE